MKCLNCDEEIIIPLDDPVGSGYRFCNKVKCYQAWQRTPTAVLVGVDIAVAKARSDALTEALAAINKAWVSVDDYEGAWVEVVDTLEALKQGIVSEGVKTEIAQAREDTLSEIDTAIVELAPACEQYHWSGDQALTEVRTVLVELRTLENLRKIGTDDNA